MSKADIRSIVDIQLGLFGSRLASQGVALDVSDAARDLIAEEGYEPSFGARPLKRAVIRMIETPVSRLILQGEYQENSTLTIDAAEDKLVFGKK